MDPQEANRLLKQDESSEEGAFPEIGQDGYDSRPHNPYLGTKPLLFHLIMFILYTSLVSWRFSRPVTDAECLQHMSLWCRSVQKSMFLAESD